MITPAPSSDLPQMVKNAKKQGAQISTRGSSKLSVGTIANRKQDPLSYTLQCWDRQAISISTVSFSNMLTPGSITLAVMLKLCSLFFWLSSQEFKEGQFNRRKALKPITAASDVFGSK